MLLGIQCLRFFAACSIVLYHAIHYALVMSVVSPGLERSPTILSSGVTVFFVISGFLMARVIDKASPIQFLAHRLLRIYPPYLVAVALVCAARVLVFGSAPPLEVAKVLTLFPSGQISYPLGVEWTLVYEVFFYFVATLLCVLPKAGLRKVAVLLWTIAIVSANETTSGAFTAMLPSFEQIPLSYFNLAFIAGMVVWWSKDLGEPRPVSTFLCGAVILILAYSTGLSPVAQYLTGAIGAALIVKSASSSQTSKFFTHKYRYLPKLGDGSYGLYLLHVPIIMAYFAIVPDKGFSAFFAAIMLAILGGIAYGLVEHRCYQKLRTLVDSKVFFSRFALHTETKKLDGRLPAES